MKKVPKFLSATVKISLSLLLLWLVFKKIPFEQVVAQVQNSKPEFLLLAFLCFVLSQLLSSYRLFQFFKAGGFHFSAVDNLKLYFVGMFYNFFIPGGIGGDAYKVYILNKKFSWNLKKLGAAVLADRIAGFVAILLLIETLSLYFLKGFWLILPFLAVIFTFFFSKEVFNRFFPSVKQLFNQSVLISAGVQLLQMGSISFSLLSLGFVANQIIYLTVFLASSLLSIISFSGIGVREWLFMKAAQFFDFQLEVSVSAALLFSVYTALLSLAGLYFQIKGLNLEKEQQ